MTSLKNFIKLIVTSHSGISSKRVCGVLGFLIVSVILIICTINLSLAPTMVEPFIYVICALLGIDSIMNPFYEKSKQ